MEADAYILRHSEQKYKTKIQMGYNELILYKREAGGSWSIVTTSLDWPAVTLTLGSNLDTSISTSGGAGAQ